MRHTVTWTRWRTSGQLGLIIAPSRQRSDALSWSVAVRLVTHRGIKPDKGSDVEGCSWADAQYHYCVDSSAPPFPSHAALFSQPGPVATNADERPYTEAHPATTVGSVVPRAVRPPPRLHAHAPWLPAGETAAGGGLRARGSTVGRGAGGGCHR